MRRTIFALLLVTGCFGNEITPFPPGLEPLEDNTAPALAAQGGDPYPEGLSEVWGDDPYAWVHARGYVKAPAAAVWAAFKDAELVADRLYTDRQTVRNATEPEYAWSYEIDYLVTGFLDVNWTEAYRFGVVEGTEEELELGMIRYQKIEGISILRLLEGSVIVRAIDADTTELELLRHLDVIMGGPSDIRRIFQNLYQKVLARVHATSPTRPARRGPSPRPAARTPSP